MSNKYIVHTSKEKYDGIPLQAAHSNAASCHRGVAKHGKLDLLRNEEEGFDHCDAEICQL